MVLNRAIIRKCKFNVGIIWTWYLTISLSTPGETPKYTLDNELSVPHTLSGYGGKDNIVTPEEY